MLLGVNREKWPSWCGLEVVVISEGAEGQCCGHSSVRITIKGELDLTGVWICLYYTIREPSEVLIPCCTKPLSKVALQTQNS